MLWFSYIDIDTSIPYTIQYWDEDPKNFESHLEFSHKRVETLELSTYKVANELADNERTAFTRMRQLEIAYFLWKQQEVSEDMVFCTSSAVLDIIQHENLHHLYFKYFDALQRDFDMDILTDIVNSYDEMIQWLACNTDVATVDQITSLGLNLINFLAEYDASSLAKQVLTSVLSYLDNSDGIELWMPLFKVYVRGMALSNQFCDFKAAEKFQQLALATKEQIGMVSFGQDLLDCSRLFIQTSIMMTEHGSLGTAYTWAQKSMQVRCDVTCHGCKFGYKSLATLVLPWIVRTFYSSRAYMFVLKFHIHSEVSYVFFSGGAVR